MVGEKRIPYYNPMKNMLIISILLVILQSTNGVDQDGFLGCYSERIDKYITRQKGPITSNECRKNCRETYFSYALINVKNMCKCSNYLGGIVNPQVCSKSCSSCEHLYDVYFTDIVVPGPPRNLKVYNVTETSAYVSWKEPESYVDISNYLLEAVVLHAFADMKHFSYKWTYSNNTYDTELNFQPGTTYNITIQAVSQRGVGVAAFKIVESLIGIPDNIPSIPNLLERQNKTMLVQLNSVINNNGPITAYRLVVINENTNQILQTENLKSYNDAIKDGVNYYIAADISPEDVDKNFTVGDGNYYGGYYNAPLDPQIKYRLISGIVSIYKNQTKIVYSNSTDLLHEYDFPHPVIASIPQMEAKPKHEHDRKQNTLDVDLKSNTKDSYEKDGLHTVIVLSVAIAVLGSVLLIGSVTFFLYTKRVERRRRMRLTNNQELTIQGPIIEVENTGYVPEDEILSTNHYDNLKNQLWNIPHSLIKIEPTNSLGIGKFGRISSGTVRKDNNYIPVAIYTIFDRKLGNERKRIMLTELDQLLRSGKHENILHLIGTCETAETLFVVLEHVSTNLKDLLLGSRDALPGRFSNMQESQALDISVGIANGMRHLQSLKIVHKQLCARNILITNSFVPKVSGYGLAQYNNPNMVPDYTRWTAAEVFRSQQYLSKSDVWSFACLLWEICVLGGTPYGSVPNNEIPNKVMRGLRLIQLRYISDDLYQLMLNCWQLDLDERPTFSDLLTSLISIKEDNLISHLNFNVYPEFQYEQFYPNMELAARTVF